MPADVGTLPGRDQYVAGELVIGKASEHRDEPVVPSHPVKAERPRHEPEPPRGEPAPTQVADDDPAACHAVEFAQHDGDLVVGEVVEQLRARDEVDARGRERECARIEASGSRR